MQPDERQIHSPSPALIGYLDFVHQIVGDSFLPRSYRQLLAGLTTPERIAEVDGDEDHPLWWFLPPILYDLFDETTQFDWLRQNNVLNASIVVVPPPFVGLTDQIQNELGLLGLASTRSSRVFTRCFVGILYGGYPWFESYIRICDARQLSEQQCTVLRVSSDTCDVPRTLETFKKRRRHLLSPSLQMVFDDLSYSGLIRPFHAPSAIENRRHMRAAEVG